MRYEEYLKSILEPFRDESLIPPEEFPRMELYLEQAVGFLNEQLRVYAAPEGDKQPITKSMVSAYAKQRALPKPTKKRYTRDHATLIAMAHYLRSAFQMGEIALLLKPFLDNYGSVFEEKYDLHKLYEAMHPMLKEERRAETDGILKAVEGIKGVMWEKGVEDDDTLELFALMLYLAVKADTAKFAADRLLKEYYAKGKEKPKKERTKKA
ncbi:MAG: DUF1836 domain-containing protein [Clostridiales Family XIII bacterium]|jgi:hypothetical protein|nr:DUF1836 domain-containing protein [Clostridiales Family XIII bacterium]